MSHYELGPLRPVMLDPNLTLLEPGAHQDHRTRHMGDLAESLGVGDGLNLVQELEVGEIVHEDLLHQDHHDSVPPEPHPFDLRPKRQLADAPGLVVVPDHDLVDRVLRVGSAPDEGEYVAAEQHLDQPNPAPVPEVPAEDFAERVAIVDPETDVRARGEAAMVLVEGEVEEGRDPGRRRGRCGAGVLGLRGWGGDGGVRVAVRAGIEEGGDGIGRLLRFDHGGVVDGVVVVGVWFGGGRIQSLRHRRRGGGGGGIRLGGGDFAAKINEKLNFLQRRRGE